MLQRVFWSQDLPSFLSKILFSMCQNSSLRITIHHKYGFLKKKVAISCTRRCTLARIPNKLSFLQQFLNMKHIWHSSEPRLLQQPIHSLHMTRLICVIFFNAFFFFWGYLLFFRGSPKKFSNHCNTSDELTCALQSCSNLACLLELINA